jgi:hypothetical protein
MSVGAGGGDGGGESGGDGEGSDGGSGDGGDEEAPPAMQGDNSVFALFGLSAVIAFLSPFAFIMLMRRNSEEDV